MLLIALIATSAVGGGLLVAVAFLAVRLATRARAAPARARTADRSEGHIPQVEATPMQQPPQTVVGVAVDHAVERVKQVVDDPNVQKV